MGWIGGAWNDDCINVTLRTVPLIDAQHTQQFQSNALLAVTRCSNIVEWLKPSVAPNILVGICLLRQIQGVGGGGGDQLRASNKSVKRHESMIDPSPPPNHAKKVIEN